MEDSRNTYFIRVKLSAVLSSIVMSCDIPVHMYVKASVSILCVLPAQ